MGDLVLSLPPPAPPDSSPHLLPVHGDNHDLQSISIPPGTLPLLPHVTHRQDFKADRIQPRRRSAPWTAPGTMLSGHSAALSSSCAYEPALCLRDRASTTDCGTEASVGQTGLRGGCCGLSLRPGHRCSPPACASRHGALTRRSRPCARTPARLLPPIRR